MKKLSLLLASLVALCNLAGTSFAQVIHHNIDIQGVAREYLVYLPTGYDGVTELPVLIVYHGGSMTAGSMMLLTGFNPIADAEGFIAVYPQGLPDGGGDPIWNSEGPFTNGVDEITYTSDMIDELDLNYAVDLDRVYATGYSNGANMAWEIACFLSDRITATAPVAGSMWTWTPGLSTPMRAVPVLSIHGTFDFYNPVGGNFFSLGLIEASEYWALNNGANLTPTIVDLPDLDPNDGSTVQVYTWSGGDGCTEVQYYRVVRGGHDWPGVFGNMDIDSSQVIWDFVSQYDMDGKIAGSSMSQIGVGAGGANIAVLNSSSIPSLGSNVQLDWSGFSGSANGFVIVSLNRVDRSLFGGTLFPDVTQILAQLPASSAADGTGSLQFTMVNNPSLLGLTAFLQVAMPDATQSHGWAFSNGLAAEICD